MAGGLTTIESYAFAGCEKLTAVTIPSGVLRIGVNAFSQCKLLKSVHFQGNAPRVGSQFAWESRPTIYRLPGTTGWSASLAEAPTALWSLPHPVVLNNGSLSAIRPGGFQLTVSWAANLPVVLEATDSLDAPNWQWLATLSLTNGSATYGDPRWERWTNRFFRVGAQ